MGIFLYTFHGIAGGNHLIMGQAEKKRTSLGLWLILWLLLLIILLKGHFSHTVVGDLGQPTWEFGAIEDVPGASPHAMYPLLPNPQHVRGRKGE